MSQGLDAVSSRSLIEYTKYGEVVTELLEPPGKPTDTQ